MALPTFFSPANPKVSWSDARAVYDASGKYGVPLGVFYGMWSNETNLSHNGSTSSKGAIGPFQFEPGTAASRGYPLTNTPSASQFQAQANAAAKYLSDLHKQTGSWGDALAAYDAGPGNVQAGRGYAQKAIDAANKLHLNTSGIGFNAAQDQNPLGNVPGVSAVTDVGSAVGSIASFLTSTANWLRIGEVIAGILLVAMGLRSLTGNTTTPVSVARRAARTAAKVAK